MEQEKTEINIKEWEELHKYLPMLVVVVNALIAAHNSANGLLSVKEAMAIDDMLSLSAESFTEFYEEQTG